MVGCLFINPIVAFVKLFHTFDEVSVLIAHPSLVGIKELHYIVALQFYANGSLSLLQRWGQAFMTGTLI